MKSGVTTVGGIIGVATKDLVQKQFTSMYKLEEAVRRPGGINSSDEDEAQQKILGNDCS